MTNKKLFQWVNGPKIGTIVELKYINIEDGVLYLNFSDGSRCNRDFIALLNETDIDNKQLAHISSETNKWDVYYEEIPDIPERWEVGINQTTGDSERFCVQTFVKGGRRKRCTPPKFFHIKEVETFMEEVNYSLHENSEKEDIILHTYSHQPLPKEKLETEKNQKSNNPIFTLLDKSKKVECNISMDLTLSLPSKNMYDIITENFDNGDNDMIDYIMYNLDIHEIKDILKNTILSAYRENNNNNNEKN